MNPIIFFGDHYLDDWIADRRRSAARFGSTTSPTLVVVEKVARAVRAAAARLEAWAHGTDDGAVAAARAALQR
jgi:hypothetical protein